MDMWYSSKDSRNQIKMLRRAASVSRHNIISPDNHRNLVLRLTDTLVAKSGPGVTAAEACALQFVARLLDYEYIRVPSFVQFFTDEEEFWPVGYLVMTFVEGTTLDRSATVDPEIIDRISRAIAHIHSFTHIVPGPPDGSLAQGLLWSDYGAGKRFESSEGLQGYIDLRLPTDHSTINVTGATLRLCHMDIAPRRGMLGGEGATGASPHTCTHLINV